MIKFAEVFPDERIVSALRRQLRWTHFLVLGPDNLRMLKKAVQQGRNERRGEGVRFGTFEPLSDVRMPLTDFF